MKKIVVIVVLVCCLGGGLWGGRKAYRTWRTDRALKNAREALAKEEYNGAMLWLRQALKSQGDNREAIQLMGDFAEVSKSPATITWRKRLVEVDPSVTNQLRLARVALEFKDFEMCRKTLLGLGEADRKSLDFIKLAAALALSSGRPMEAMQLYKDALKQAPGDPLLQVNLATLMVQSSDSKEAALGFGMLESLKTDAVGGLEATRHLAFDAFRKTNYARAIPLAEQLVNSPKATVQDRLMHLGLLAATSNSQLSGTLRGYQQRSGTNIKEVFELSRWMLAFRGANETTEWLKTLPPKISTNVPVTIVVADSLLGQRNWAGLQQYVSAQSWGELDCLRYSFLSRSLREQNLAVASKAEWVKAVKACQVLLDRLQTLAQVTTSWGWEVENEEILTTIVNRFPAERSSKQQLVDSLSVRGKTRSLLALFASESQLDPKNLAVKNNLASLALLLGAMEHKPHELAAEVYKANPENPSFVTTYAHSLYLQKKNAEALAVLQKLKPEILAHHRVAGYYGLCLAASGPDGKQKAGIYFDAAEKGNLLPEEAQLFRRSRP